MKSKNNKVIVLHSQIDSINDPPDEQDVLVQAQFVVRALDNLGWDPLPRAFLPDLSSMRDLLRAVRPVFVVNLVETVFGTGRFISLAPNLLEMESVPYTGSSSAAVFITSNKVLTKKYLCEANLPTPPAVIFNDNRIDFIGFPCWDMPYLVKPVWEDGSVGISEDSLVTIKSREHLVDVVDKMVVPTANNKFTALGPHELFLEYFIEGREFNIALLQNGIDVEILPPSEIMFNNFEETMPKILSYNAKWDHSSWACRNTVRTFNFSKEDLTLLDRLKTLSLKCWQLFDLRGYARIDFRVDKDLNPWIIDINANPCLSPDGGFMASALLEGFTIEDVVNRIIPLEVNKQ